MSDEITTELQDYPRPEFTQDERREAAHMANRIEAQPAMKRQAGIFMLLIENASLLREVNEHRRARGFKELKEHK
jgi:hypothetical protein